MAFAPAFARMRRVLVLLAAFAVAGCLSAPLPSPSDAEQLTNAPTLFVAGMADVGGTTHILSGTLEAGVADTIPFSLSLPPNYWDANPGALEVSVVWGLYEGRDFDLAIRDGQGRFLTAGIEPDAGIGVRSTHALQVPGSAAVALIEKPAAGAYEAVVTATTKGGDYEIVFQIEDRTWEPGPVHDLLPNLITLEPLDLAIRDPDGIDPAMRAAGVKGCRADEVAELGVTRCLRFSNGIANVGAGPLEMILVPAEGGKSIAGQGGRFIERILQSDGTTRDAEVGTATLHANHGHFHYTGAALFQLFHYDVATKTRGEPASESRKTGFCFADLSLAALGLPHTTPPRFDGSGCFDPTVHSAWTTGLMPNWYDRYDWSWFEQYIDVSNVGDGVYELVSTANVQGTLLETDLSDNSSSTVFRLEGDEVTHPIQGG